MIISLTDYFQSVAAVVIEPVAPDPAPSEGSVDPLPSQSAVIDGSTQDGTSGGDAIDGGGGDDTLRGFSGDDTLSGADGDDLLIGGAGADVLIGGAGIDVASYLGSVGSLRVDILYPSLNTNVAMGDTYDSIENLVGSQGFDNLRGTYGDNLIQGMQNVDYIYGRRGDDTIEGGAGDDVLFGGVGQDVLRGGDHRDRAQYSESLVSLVLDLADPSQNTGEAAGDSYESIEDLAGGHAADIICGDAAANRLFGREGEDDLFGRDGDDYLNGGAHSDTLSGGAGDDTLRGGTHADKFVFNEGADVIEDFNLGHADTIEIVAASVSAVSGLNGAQVLAQFATVSGGNVVLDFATEGSLTLENVNSLAGLEDYILVI